MRAYHNSRDPYFRTPFGAVKTGTDVTLAIDVYDVGGMNVTLRTWSRNLEEVDYPMACDWMGDHGHFYVTITPEKPEIVWYNFLIRGDLAFEAYYGPRQGSVGGVGQEYYQPCPTSFQLTVYDERPVPEWFKNGVAYQIFPDRFHRGLDFELNVGKFLPLHQNGVHRRIVGWDEPPYYNRGWNHVIQEYDFYGGTLMGIEEKLPYLRDLGITVLYLNPIFEAESNHRYDTGDFTQIDPLLGTEDDFKRLCKKAEEFGISIILDGVFNHVGADSKYFNRFGNYDEVGAYQSEDSKYREWFKFDEYGGYSSWWGINDLPDINEDVESYRKFIYKDKDSIVRRWLRAGAKGWRLDVADELPDDFIEGIKKAVVAEKGEDGLLMGEVWEDASHKTAYGKLRTYFSGHELDSTMNYPFRDGVMGFMKGWSNAYDLAELLTSLQENYPPQNFYGALNLLGSHDRARILTAFGDAPRDYEINENDARYYRLPEEKLKMAKGRLWIASLLQMSMPGVPCIYYGDEAGMQGYNDPFNRGPYPWGWEEKDCMKIVRNAINLRKSLKLFAEGDFHCWAMNDEVFCISRSLGDMTAVTVVNRSIFRGYDFNLNAWGEAVTELLNNDPVKIYNGNIHVELGPLGSKVFLFTKWERLCKPMPRGRGILCHVTSLPNNMSQGTFNQECFDFIDFLAAKGQNYWQLLPLNPPDKYNSPYAGASAFAGSEALIGRSRAELENDFAGFYPSADYDNFVKDNEHWLSAWAMFATLAEKFGTTEWIEWPEEYRRYKPEFYDDEGLKERSRFFVYVQYVFEKKWQRVKEYANSRGISIIGDIPIYVSASSADVWTNPDCFSLNEDMTVKLEAGVPPDMFSATGQLWGNPVYNWEAMKKDGYRWWINRMKRAFSLYDFVRLDHFRGFEAYWAVPHGLTALEGSWVQGPGMDLFNAAYKELGQLPILAEDLGFITPGVNAMIAQLGIMGTQVVQFNDDDPLQPLKVHYRKIAYPGTHDSNTIIGWVQQNRPNMDAERTAIQFLDNIYNSDAPIIITPLQDLIGLGDDTRMNKPGTSYGNWSWQAHWDMFFTRNWRIDRILHR